MFNQLFRRLPIAWLQVAREKVRLLVAVAGITFADILMFTQMGFQDALYESTMRLQRSLDADLVITNPKMQTLFTVKSFPRERIYQALGVEGVNSVSPVYIASAEWRHPENGSTRMILVFGVDPRGNSFALPEVKQNRHQLQSIGNILFDQGSRPEYGAIAQSYLQGQTVETEVNYRTVRVSGLFTIGASFSADGNIIASDTTFLYIFPERSVNQIEVGLVKLKPGADVAIVKQQLQQQLGTQVSVLSREEFAQVERQYWAESTPIGYIFGLGVIVGFIVGIVIVYQILYSDVTDHLPQYATLKAMGYSNSYLIGVLIQEALILAVLGYLPSALLALVLYELAAGATLLPIAMTSSRALTVLMITLVMCITSGLIAMKKLQSADPAEIF